ncbi:MAG: GNAT family N-acetyltransferase [Rhodobacteraceae bacterium]|nr:GNAT family N-acetyltransferase [Paracoccaceae bacterium]
MTPALRRYAPNDCAACWQVFYRAVQIGAAKVYNQAQRNVWCATLPRPTVERNARLADATTWVAKDTDRLIGFMSLEANGHLDMAFVDPDYMGQGVAYALHNRLIQSARKSGLTKLTTEASLMAEPFFARQGWQMITPDTVKRGGVSLPRYLMQIAL